MKISFEDAIIAIGFASVDEAAQEKFTEEKARLADALKKEFWAIPYDQREVKADYMKTRESENSQWRRSRPDHPFHDDPPFMETVRIIDRENEEEYILRQLAERMPSLQSAWFSGENQINGDAVAVRAKELYQQTPTDKKHEARVAQAVSALEIEADRILDFNGYEPSQIFSIRNGLCAFAQQALEALRPLEPIPSTPSFIL